MAARLHDMRGGCCPLSIQDDGAALGRRGRGLRDHCMIIQRQGIIMCGLVRRLIGLSRRACWPRLPPVRGSPAGTPAGRRTPSGWLTRRHRSDRQPGVSVRRSDPDHIYPPPPAHPAPIPPSRRNVLPAARLVGPAPPRAAAPTQNGAAALGATWDGWSSPVFPQALIPGERHSRQALTLPTPPTMYASCATRRSERIGLLSAAHAEPNNMRAPTAQIEPPTQRAEHRSVLTSA